MLLFAIGFGPVLAASLEVEPVKVIGALVGAGVGMGVLGGMPQGSATAGVFKEIFIDQLMEKFYGVPSFLDAATDMTEFVEFNTINLADIGVDPAVLINNTTFPVPAAVRADAALALPLDNFDTENTIVRNLEEVETAYNKRESVIRQHRNSIMEVCGNKAAHAYSPASDTADTPVLVTTGAVNPVTGLKRLTLEDLAEMKRRLDVIKVPALGRWGVLHPDHVADLIVQDKDLFKVFTNIAEGTVPRIFGFSMFEYPTNAIYLHTTGVKQPFGAAPDANDATSSFFFHTAEVMKADGTVDMFIRENDPEQRGDIIGFQKRFVALPMRDKFNGAIHGTP